MSDQLEQTSQGFSFNFIFLLSHFWAHVHVACCLLSADSVTINRGESNNRDRSEWRGEEVPESLDVYGELNKDPSKLTNLIGLNTVGPTERPCLLLLNTISSLCQ